MLDALDRYGMGNWIDISEAIGSKTLEETRDHYLTHYLDSQSSPLPASSRLSLFRAPCLLTFLFFSFLFFSFLFFSFLFFSFLFFSFLFFSFLFFAFLFFAFLFFSFLFLSFFSF